MKKLSILFFFFTLSLFIASTGFAHSGSGSLSRLRTIIPHHLKAPSKYYYEKDGERYYIDNVPPTVKGKRIDHSKVWLLNDDIAQIWH